MTGSIFASFTHHCIPSREHVIEGSRIANKEKGG